MRDKQYVELFHLLFLEQLGRKIDKNLYALKGGCNLRFYFKSIRYSEDIDLDVRTIRVSTLQNNVQKIFESTPFKNILRARQIEILRISAPKQTEIVQRWKLLLKIPESALPLHTKIEFSRRANTMAKETEFTAIDPELIRFYHLTPIFTNHYSGNIAFQQKLEALISRTQIQARDVFDLYLLLHRGINFKQALHQSRDQLAKARDHALSISFDNFKGQVLAYLSPEYQKQYDSKDVWEKIVLSVIQSLDENA